MSERTERLCSRWLRVAVGAILAATCVRVWLGPINFVPQAQAQIPNAGAQRADLVREAERTNQLLTEIVQILKTETLNVQVTGTDKKTEAHPRAIAPVKD